MLDARLFSGVGQGLPNSLLVSVESSVDEGELGTPEQLRDEGMIDADAHDGAIPRYIDLCRPGRAFMCVQLAPEDRHVGIRGHLGRHNTL